MQIDSYSKIYKSYFASEDFLSGQNEAIALLLKSRRIFFIGNGGSNAICSHMMEDYAKIASYQSFAFSDPALITCFSNDFGYENAMAEWLKIYFSEGDVLVAISSSGNSPNILNAVGEAAKRGKVITLSGFKHDNKLKTMGNINFYIDASNYGILECFHQIILHVILDEIAGIKNHKIL